MNHSSISQFFTPASPRVRQKLCLSLLALLVAAALLAINLLAGLLPWSVRGFSFEENAAFGISSPTKSALHALTSDVSIYLVTEDGELNLDRDLYSFLKSYEALSNHIKVGTVSTKADPDFLTSRGLEIPEEIAFLVESELRCRLVTMSELYYYECVNSADGEEVIINLTPAEYVAYGQSFLNSRSCCSGDILPQSALASSLLAKTISTNSLNS